MKMPHSSVIPDYRGGFSELREVTDNIMDPSNPVDVGLMGLGMAPIPGARVPIGLRTLSKAAQYILQNGLGKARRFFPKGAIDDAVVELGKRESQIIKKSKEVRDYKKSDYMKDAREGLRRKERNKRSQDLMTKKDPDYYLDDYPVEKPLGFAGGGMPTIMMNPDMPVPDMPVMRFQRGGMPRSPLMMQEPFIPQRPPRMFINDEVPTNDFVPFSEREGFGELPPEFMPPPPRKQFLQRPLSIEEERPPMQYIGEGAPPEIDFTPQYLDPRFIEQEALLPEIGTINQTVRPPMQYIGEDAPRMGMPPEMPQLPGMPSIEQRLPSIEQRLPSIEQIQRPPSIEQMPQPVEQMPQPIGQEPLPIGQEPQPMIPPVPEPMPHHGDYYNTIRKDFLTETAPEPMMPPGMEEEMAQPTQDQFMERLMQMIQGLQERRQPAPQPAPQPAQQMAPPPPRPPATPFNMGNSGMSGGAPTMPQMFNQGPGFFTPQQSGPKIAPGAIAQQTQELMPNYNLDFSSFLRNR